HRVIRILRQAFRMSLKMPRTSFVVVRPSGSRSVARNHRGRAPRHATSLALMLTAYQPIRSDVKVMGSVLTTRQESPRSMTAASSPKRGPATTRDDLDGRQEPRRASRNRGGNFPTGKAHGSAIVNRV